MPERHAPAAAVAAAEQFLPETPDGSYGHKFHRTEESFHTYFSAQT